MKIDNLNELPEWNDDDPSEHDEEGESWKPNPTRSLCKALYQQWNQVMIVLNAAFDSLKEPGDDSVFGKDYFEDHKSMLLGDAYEVAAKIRSSEAGLYIIRMENAAIIRKNAQFIKVATNGFVMDGVMEEEHRLFIREEIDKFREIFKEWVASFEKDDYGDEWGLFI
ncbi:hypothetical protein [Foetidibacter luteolus]|uniref:hypothetical protein n=1 Tax=Foetidibacter luteolus TaxID=2608880 RepID=UPI00129BB5FA|nr:hypothetical protein [Foetidibacter luteolus]